MRRLSLSILRSKPSISAETFLRIPRSRHNARVKAAGNPGAGYWRSKFALPCSLCLLVFYSLVIISNAAAQPASETPIYPVWRLMDDNAKRQFLAGYLYGFREARSLGEVALEYSKTKPQDLEEGLSAILQHYKLTTLAPDKLAPLLDEYLQAPERQNDSLRLAINRLQQLPVAP